MLQDSRCLECFLAKCAAALLVKLLYILDLIKLRAEVKNIQGESSGPKRGTSVGEAGTDRGNGQRRRKTTASWKKTTGAAGTHQRTAGPDSRSGRRGSTS